MSNDEVALRELEARRCNALSSDDVEALRSLLAPSYRHVHANGRIDDLATYLDAVGTNPRFVAREDLHVRVHTDYAELLGRQVNTFADRKSELVAYQIAGRTGTTWQFLSTVVVRLQP